MKEVHQCKKVEHPFQLSERIELMVSLLQHQTDAEQADKGVAENRPGCASS